MESVFYEIDQIVIIHLLLSTLIIVFRILAAKKSKYEAVPEGADNVSASVPTPEETVTDTDSPVNESEKAGSAGEETGEGKSDGDTD